MRKRGSVPSLKPSYSLRSVSKQCSFVKRPSKNSQERHTTQWHQDTSNAVLGVGDVIAPRYRAFAMEGDICFDCGRERMENAFAAGRHACGMDIGTGVHICISGANGYGGAGTVADGASGSHGGLLGTSSLQTVDVSTSIYSMWKVPTEHELTLRQLESEWLFNRVRPYTSFCA